MVSQLWPSMLTTSTTDPLGFPGTGSAGSLNDPAGVTFSSVSTATAALAPSAITAPSWLEQGGLYVAIFLLAVLLIAGGGWVLLNG
jgi:hypothetical protein